MLMLGETYSDSASDDSKDYGFDDTEFSRKTRSRTKKQEEK
jgi:hypothetical protein